MYIKGPRSEAEIVGAAHRPVLVSALVRVLVASVVSTGREPVVRPVGVVSHMAGRAEFITAHIEAVSNFFYDEFTIFVSAF